MEPLTDSTRVRAEMARRGLLWAQRLPYESPDTGRLVFPQHEPEQIAEVWSFLTWLETEALK